MIGVLDELELTELAASIQGLSLVGDGVVMIGAAAYPSSVAACRRPGT